MSRQDLIDNYMETKRLKDSSHLEYLKEQRIVEKEKGEKIIRIVESAGGKFIHTNGYVYDFEYKGTKYTVCDQKERIVGNSHILPETESDIEFLKNESCSAFSFRGCEQLKLAFNYKEICIDLPLEAGISKLLKGD